METHRFSSASNYNFDNQTSETCNTRRSIDWRDSGIVIDDDHLIFQSIETLKNSPQDDAIARTKSSQEIDQASEIFTPAAISPLIDDDGDTMLHIAIVGLPKEQVKDLIAISDLNVANDMLQTPLHLATMVDRCDIVQILLESGAKTDMRDRRGNTPLHIACQKGLCQIADVMLTHAFNQGEDEARKCLQTANFDGQTCIHMAASNGQQDIIKLLVFKFKADINSRDSRSGETIMHKAIKRLDKSLVVFIASMSQHCNLADYCGRRPLDTIRMMKQSSSSFEMDITLNKMEEAISYQIKVCCAREGCCTGLDVGNYIESNSSSESDSDYN